MAEQAVNDEHAEIKKRAMRRLIVAGALVTAAVVTLTMLNHTPEQTPAPANKPEVTAVAEPQPFAPETAQEKPAEEEPIEAPAPESPIVPDSEAAPEKLPEPPPPQVINRKLAPVAASAPKSRTEAAGMTMAEPAKAGTPQSVTISPAPSAKKTAEPAAVESRPAPVSATSGKATETTPPKGYVVQLGLFSNYENAAQLQKRLADHGIKSYTETRLHVGPFQNKAEADQAMAKIRSMGINAVLAPAR